MTTYRQPLKYGGRYNVLLTANNYLSFIHQISICLKKCLGKLTALIYNMTYLVIYYYRFKCIFIINIIILF